MSCLLRSVRPAVVTVNVEHAHTQTLKKKETIKHHFRGQIINYFHIFFLLLFLIANGTGILLVCVR